MNRTLWEARIPTLLGLALISFGVIVTSFLVKTGTNIIGKASETNKPEDIRISNVTDASFTVSFSTRLPVLASINYGTDKNFGDTANDDRNNEETRVHSITVKNLSPQTKYLFSIISGQSTFLDDGLPFETSTGPQIAASPATVETLRGKVSLPAENSPNEAIVYLSTPNSQVLSVKLAENGSYELPISSMRTKDLASYVQISDTLAAQLLIVGASQTSNVTLNVRKTNPVPTVILSQNYDFTLSNLPLDTQTGSQSGNTFGFPSLSANLTSQTSQISTPQKNQKFTDSQPLFRGTASPSAKIKIIIHSPQNIEDQTTADERGVWTYRPKDPLTPGLHTLSIITQDQFGILKTITQSFTVYAAGSQVDQSATPSATPILSITPTTIPATNPVTETPTPTPTFTPVPTLIPTVPPTAVPLAPPGNSLLWSLSVTGFLTIFFGILLFLRGKKASL